jgi:hypothetical protein
VRCPLLGPPFPLIPLALARFERRKSSNRSSSFVCEATSCAASNGIRRASVSRPPLLPTITLGKFSIQMGLSCPASTNGVRTSILHLIPITGHPATASCCFSVSMISDPALQRARSLVSRLEEEPTSIQTLERRSSRSEIRTDITLRSVRSLRAEEALQRPKVAGVQGLSPTPFRRLAEL